MFCSIDLRAIVKESCELLNYIGTVSTVKSLSSDPHLINEKGNSEKS